jgi:hypothetical protein
MCSYVWRLNGPHHVNHSESYGVAVHCSAAVFRARLTAGCWLLGAVAGLVRLCEGRGFRVVGSGFKVQGLGFTVGVLGFGV